MQIGKSEYASAVITQTNARVVQIGARHIDMHIGTRAVLSPGVTHLAAGTSHRHSTVTHTGHASMVHPCHGSMAHAAHGLSACCAVVHTCHACAHGAHHVRHGQPL